MKKNKILVYGYINTNVLDGSSVFLTSLCHVLSKDGNSIIDLVLATPRNRDVILDSIKEIDNINIIDPFNEKKFSHFDFHTKGQMTVNDGAELINFCDSNNEYNSVFIRSLDVSEKLSNLNPDIISKTFSYITGITFSDQEINEETQVLLQHLESLQGRLLCQTNQMKEHLKIHVHLKSTTIIDLKPMIPDIVQPFEEIFEAKEKYDTFAYTGKFAPEWNTIPMIVQFREIQEMYPEAQLYVAGDQFKFDMNNPDFRNITKYLLENTKNLTWFGALNRSESLALIENSDIGLTWRAEGLEKSLELSTKMLEYCSEGKPPILNKIEMHKEIFGEDYPFYANNEEEFFNVIKKILNNPLLVEEWAKRVYDIAKGFTFNSTFIRLYPYICNTDLEESKEEMKLIEKVFESQELEVYHDLLAFPLKKDKIVNYIVETLKYGKVEKYKFINNIVVMKIDFKKVSSEEETQFLLQKFVSKIFAENEPFKESKINFEELMHRNTKHEIKVDNLQNKTMVSEEKYIQTRDFANMANEKYKDTMEKYKKSSAFASLANEKYKDTMEKYKKLLKSYRALQKKYKEAQNRVKEN